MKFVIDGMLGSLARWLRLMGHEVDYVKDTPDAELLQRAREAVLLTSDLALYRTATARGLETHLIKGKTQAEKLSRVAKRFGLTLRVNASTSRCPTCGSLISAVDKESVHLTVPAATLRRQKKFWKCVNSQCGKVYWRGAHWKRIEETLIKARALEVSKQRGGRKPLYRLRGRTSHS